MTVINFRRGLFQMWTAFSVVWLVGGGVMLQEEIRSEFSVMRIEVAGPWQQYWTFDDVETALRAADEAGNVEDARRLAVIVDRFREAAPGMLVGRAPEKAQERLIDLTTILLLPPILLFALGWAGLWIVRGFRS